MVCQIGEEKKCLLDTGAGLSYLRDSQVSVSGKSLGKRKTFIQYSDTLMLRRWHVGDGRGALNHRSLWDCDRESDAADGPLRLMHLGNKLFEKGVIKSTFQTRSLGKTD